MATIQSPHRPHREHRVPVSPDRNLGTAELGDPEGVPVLWFHGTPGGRLQLPPDAHDSAVARGLRLLGVERPGTGWSTPHHYHEVRDFADDIRTLTETLELERFCVVGLSGGGPYTLACAHEMPDRVIAAGVIGGVAPITGFDAPPGQAEHIPAIMPIISKIAEQVARALPRVLPALAPYAPKVVRAFSTLVPKADREILMDPAFMEVLVGDLLHVSPDGLSAFAHDIRLFAEPWGFELRNIRVPVHFFQGDADTIVPEPHGRHQAERVADSGLTILEGGGHLAGYIDAGRVFDTLMPHIESERKS